MKIIRGVRGLKSLKGRCVATIGNFDGVHLGHETVIRFLAAQAKRLELPMVVITFEPHPKEFFVPEFAPPRISILRDKISRLAALGVDQYLLLKFNQSLAKMSAERFIREVLVEGLGIEFLVVGDDFRFGFKREGDYEMLQRAGKEFDFSVAQMPTYEVDGARVSSTRVRQALSENDFVTAEKLLGRPYRISGRVTKGEQLGRELGFPTANILLPQFQMVVAGVYAVKVVGIEESPLAGFAYVGNRPSVAGTYPMLEVHLINFNGDLYGRYIGVDFYHHVRSEVKCHSLDELKWQIGQDVNRAKEFFQTYPQVV